MSPHDGLNQARKQRAWRDANKAKRQAKADLCQAKEKYRRAAAIEQQSRRDMFGNGESTPEKS